MFHTEKWIFSSNKPFSICILVIVWTLAVRRSQFSYYRSS